MDNNIIENFKQELIKITNLPNYDGWMYTTDDWTIGYHYPCKTCGCIVMEYTDVKIPFNSTNDQVFNDILNDLCIDYIPKAHWIYDDWENTCHCGEDDAVWNEEEDCWELIDDYENYDE